MTIADLKNLNEWIPYLILVLCSGFINCFIAWFDLDRKCRTLPFFEPLKSCGFYLWSIVQISVPSIISWFIFSLDSKPTIDTGLICQSIVLGITFYATLHANTEIGTLTINIKPIYDLFLDLAYKIIASQYNSKSAKFWTDLEKELQSDIIDIYWGLLYLENYFFGDFSLDDRKKIEMDEKITKIFQLSQKKPERVKEILLIFKTEIRRKDLAEALKRFNCSSQFLQQYNLK